MLIDSKKQLRLPQMIILIRNWQSNTIAYSKKGKFYKMVFFLFILDKMTLLNNMHDLDDKRTKTL